MEEVSQMALDQEVEMKQANERIPDGDGLMLLAASYDM